MDAKNETNTAIKTDMSDTLTDNHYPLLLTLYFTSSNRVVSNPWRSNIGRTLGHFNFDPYKVINKQAKLDTRTQIQVEHGCMNPSNKTVIN